MSGVIRRLSAALAAAALLCACHSSGPAAPAARARLSEAFTCTVRVSQGGSEYIFDYFRLGAGRCAVSFSSPAQLKGLSFELSGKSLSLRYGSLESQAAARSLPRCSYIVLLSDIFDSASSAAVKAGAVRTGAAPGAATLTGSCPEGRYTVFFGPGGDPVKISVPSRGFAASVSDFRRG